MITRLLQTAVLCALPVISAAAPTDVPVVFHGNTLFRIQTGVGSFTPQDRARAVEERLARLSQVASGEAGSLALVDGATGTDIAAGHVVLFSVTDLDAQAAGKPRHILAVEYLKTLRTALRDSRERGLKELAKNLTLGLLFTAIFVLLLKLLQIGFARFRLLSDSWRGTRIRGIRLQRLELLTARRITWVLNSAAMVVHAAVVLVAFYFYVSLVLGIFPSTRALSDTLFAYTVSGMRATGRAFAEYAPNLFMIALIAAITHYALKACRYVFQGFETGMLTVSGFYREWASPTYKIVRLLLLAAAAVVVFPYVPGHDSPAFKGVSIFFGVLLSFGSAGAVGNIVSGVLLTYTRAFQVGDRVRIADTLGDVTETTLLATHVRTVKNEDVTVPNSLVLSSHIVNFNCRAGALILHTGVTIGYDAAWRTVHQLLISAAVATEHILADPPPFVLQTGLDDFYVHYQINAYTDTPSKMVTIYSELFQNIQDKFNEAGVEICSPHFASLRDGNRIAIPDDYVPATYNAPAFRVFAGAQSRASTSS